MVKVKDIPGGWITVLVGGAVFIYILGNSDSSETLTKLSDDTVGLGERKVPGGLLGTLGILAAAGAFLNEQTMGKLT